MSPMTLFAKVTSEKGALTTSRMARSRSKRYLLAGSSRVAGPSGAVTPKFQRKRTDSANQNRQKQKKSRDYLRRDYPTGSASEVPAQADQ